MVFFATAALRIGRYCACVQYAAGLSALMARGFFSLLHRALLRLRALSERSLWFLVIQAKEKKSKLGFKWSFMPRNLARNQALWNLLLRGCLLDAGVLLSLRGLVCGTCAHESEIRLQS